MINSVSVIISFYERLSHLKCCLDALRACRNDFSEVVIADDGSREETVEAIRMMIPSYPFRIIHAWQPKDGFRLASVRNNGIRNSSGEYLIFIDCDFVLLPGTIRSHIECAKRRRFVAGLCKYLPEEQTRSLMAQGITPERLERFYKALPERPITREHWKFFRYSMLIRIGLANERKQRCSSHFSIHRADMEAINGYDENFVGWGGEDEDISLRMVKVGFRGYSVIREAKTLHLWHHKELGEKHWREGSNIEYLYRKNIPSFCENGLIKKAVVPGEDNEPSGRSGKGIE
ncbi:MAG: glycosyltransferase [Candidatus Methylomirabilis sp.]|nr:glycosyltransferase [Deltaproteobacteria bacterium]